MTNFCELREKIADWTADDEDILLRKLKGFSDNYSKKCEDLQKNLDNLNKNINLVEVDYFNALNSLKIISLKKFVEHVVDTESQNPKLIHSNNNVTNKTREHALLLSKEEREANLLSKFKNSISKSLENLNIKNLIDVGPAMDKESVIEDDNVSVSSSRYFAKGMSKGYKNLKLPFIIGTQEFFRNEYLGISPSEGALSLQNNQEDQDELERKISSISDMNRNMNILDDLNLNNQNLGETNTFPKLINSEIQKNNGVIGNSKSNIPSVPNIPAVPKFPTVPKVPNPPIVKKTTSENLISSQHTIEEVNTTIKINNLNSQNESNFNNDISYKILSSNSSQQQSEPLSFKESLKRKFGGVSEPTNTSTNDLSNQFQQLQQPNNNQPSLSSNSDLKASNFSQSNIPLPSSLVESTKPKQIKLDQFIKRGTGLFNDEEDDEEDRTGLFKRPPIDNRLGRKSLFDTRITNNLSNQTSNREKEEEPKNNDNFNFSNSNQTTKEEDLTTSIPSNLSRSKTLFNRKDDMDMSSERNISSIPIPSLPGHKKTISADIGDKKNFNLEKAKSNLLRMFDDENEEEISKPSVVSAKINEKSNDLNNKLNILLANEPEKKSDQKKNIFDDEPKQTKELKENNSIKLPIQYTNTNNPPVSNISIPKQSIKRPIFLDDDEDESIDKRVQKKPENSFTTMTDPLSSTSNLEFKPKKNISKDPLSMMADIIKSTKKEEKNSELNINRDLHEKESVKEVISKSENKLNLTDQLSDLKFTVAEDTQKNIIYSGDVNLITDSNNQIKENSESSKIESKSISHIEDPENESIKNEESNKKPANKFGDIQNMLGNKMGFGPMMMLRPEGFSKPKQDEKKEVVVSDSEEKTYMNIVSEKTKVVTKKKPQLRKFNSNMTEQRVSNVASNDRNSNFSKENEILFTKKATEDIFEIKEVNKQIFEKSEINEDKKIHIQNINISEDPSILKEKNSNTKNSTTQENKQNTFEQDLNKNISSTKKLIFDEFPDTSVSPAIQEPKKPKETKLKSKLFDFEDDDVDEIKKKRSETKLPNMDSGKQSKIKFLFDD